MKFGSIFIASSKKRLKWLIYYDLSVFWDFQALVFYNVLLHAGKPSYWVQIDLENMNMSNVSRATCKHFRLYISNGKVIMITLPQYRCDMDEVKFCCLNQLWYCTLSLYFFTIMHCWKALLRALISWCCKSVYTEVRDYVLDLYNSVLALCIHYPYLD